MVQEKKRPGQREHQSRATRPPSETLYWSDFLSYSSAVLRVFARRGSAVQPVKPPSQAVPTRAINGFDAPVTVFSPMSDSRAEPAIAASIPRRAKPALISTISEKVLAPSSARAA